ncbi:MAG: hypothetical protein ABSC65_24555 [Acidobacteriaceae bacterium]|jgi:predicted SnoaL-like aldol condensation-catalyzing enzyme
MTGSDIEKVSKVFEGISAGDVSLATRYVDHKRFVQHNPYAGDGVEGLTRPSRLKRPPQMKAGTLK